MFFATLIKTYCFTNNLSVQINNFVVYINLTNRKGLGVLFFPILSVAKNKVLNSISITKDCLLHMCSWAGDRVVITIIIDN